MINTVYFLDIFVYICIFLERENVCVFKGYRKVRWVEVSWYTLQNGSKLDRHCIFGASGISSWYKMKQIDNGYLL